MKAISEHALDWWAKLLAVAQRYDEQGSPQQRAFKRLAEEHGIDVAAAEQRRLADAIEQRLPLSELPSAVFAFADQKQLEIVPFFGERLMVQQREAGVRHDLIIGAYHSAKSAESGALEFLIDRLKVQQREAGVRHDLIDAVFALGNEDDLVRLLARVSALQNFIQTEDGANLLAGYKRAANILKKEDWQGVEGEIAQTGEEDPLALVDDPDLAPVIAAKMEQQRENEHAYSPEPAEKALIEALDSAEPRARAAVEAEDFEAAMAALAILRAPIDRFFDEVTVNDADKAKRAARLALLARFRDAVHQVADFSRIEG